jgi:hypothetical protein
MAQAMENIANSDLEPYRMPAKNLQATARTLVGTRFPRGHLDKKRFEQGMGYLKIVVI